MASKQTQQKPSPISGRFQDIKKVAMLGSYPPLRGISSYCFGLAGALAALVRVEFISFKHLYPRSLYPGGDLSDDNSFPDTPIDDLHVRRRLSWYNPFGWIWESLSMDGDLLHAQWWSMPLAPVYACLALGFKIRKKPVLFTIHNVLSHEDSFLFFSVSRLLFKLGDHFIVHSRNNRQQLSALYGISPDRTSLIPHGSLDFQVRCDADSAKIRKRFGFAKADKVILLFGAIRPYKGVDTAMRAFKKVLKKFPQAKLLIAGLLWEDWTPYSHLMDELRITAAVQTHLDYIPAADVHHYFEAADLVLLPYHHFDSQSGVGSSAIAFGKPLIVSDVGGLPELVTDKRWVVPPRDANALSRAVITCFKDANLLAQMSLSADKIAAGLGWPVIAKKTIAVYRRLVRAGKLRRGR